MIGINKLEGIRHNYDDIINYDYPVSSVSMESRACQFAPFAALTGYGDEIREKARIVDSRIDISDDLKEKINSKLLILSSMINDNPLVTIIYFVPDRKKNGGKYETISNRVKSIDLYKYEIVFVDKVRILINDIIDIDIKKAND